MRTHFLYVLACLLFICSSSQIFAQAKKTTDRRYAQEVETATQQNKSKTTYTTKAEKYAADGLTIPATSKKSASTSGKTQSGGAFITKNSSNVSLADERCITDLALEERLQDPAYVAYRESLSSAVSAKRLEAITCDAGNSIIIPVAIHFNNAYNASNIACVEAAINAQIASLNADFAAENADITKYTDILDSCAPNEECVASDGVCITFCVADQNHPAGYGLNDGDMAYTIGQFNAGGFGAGGTGAGADWAGYLNMFIIDGLGFGVADGIPGAANGDGVTQDGAFFGGPGFAPCSSGGTFNDDAAWILGRTMTHEVGHYLGLYHTFQGGCGDEPQAPYPVTDTPAQPNSSSGCPASSACGTLSGCTAGEYVQYNYMDYFDDPCLVMFSQEQAAAMNTFANATTWAANKVSCTLPTYNPIIACSFRAAFDPADGTAINICTDNGTAIQFTDASSTTATSFTWTFAVAGTATIDITSSTLENPVINVTSGDGTSGTLTVTLESTDGVTIEITTQTYPLTVLSGANCPNECDYTLNLTDTFGDGWNGATVEVFQDGASLGVFGGAFATGTTDGPYIIALTDGSTIDIVQTNGGFANEEGFTLLDPFGFTVASLAGGAPLTQSFTASCSLPTCTDGIQNGDETGVDCGGVTCGDCCGNGIQDADETGVDCGGLICALCPSCPADFTEVINENFDTCAQPAGWTVTSTGTATIANGDFSFSGSPTDLPGAGAGAGPPADFVGCIALIDDDNDQANVGIHCIITPVIDITAFMNTSLTFDWQHEELGGSTFNVEVFDGTNWVNVFTSAADANGNNETANLDAYANSAFQIRFCYDDAGGWAWGAAIDNVAICGQPNNMCPTEITTNDVSGDYCDSTVATVTANDNPNVTYAWSSDNANIQLVDATAASTSVEFSALTACTIETANISLVATCILDGVELFNGVVSTVNVYPAPPATTDDLEALLTFNEGTCMEPVTVSVGCEDFITLTPDTANPTFPADEGTTGTAAYTATYAPALSCCPDISGSTADIILDGDFESGAPGSGWTEFSDQPFAVIANNFPLNGAFGIWLGGIAVGITNVQQTITIAPTAVAADLSFNIAAGQCDCAGGDDMQVLVNGTVVWSLCNPVAGQADGEATLCNGLTDPTAGLIVNVGPIDVTAFADGNPYTLEINSFEAVDDGVNTSIFVDDVVLIVEQPAGVDACTVDVTGNYDCMISSPMVSIGDPCDCADGLDLNDDGINDILVETITIMPGTAPYTVTAYSDLSTTGLVDMAGNAYSDTAVYPDGAAALEALIVNNPDGTATISVYIPADGVSVFSIEITDGNGATSFFIKDTPCTSCEPAEQVPTVGEWGLIILGLMMSIVAIVGIRERRKVYA